jgi:hypothetical protein
VEGSGRGQIEVQSDPMSQQRFEPSVIATPASPFSVLREAEVKPRATLGFEARYPRGMILSELMTLRRK